MRRTALAVSLLVAACAATPTPTRDQLADTLAERVEPTDLTHIACEPLAADPAEFACRWRQREGRYWRDWQGYFALSGAGWHTIDGGVVSSTVTVNEHVSLLPERSVTVYSTVEVPIRKVSLGAYVDSITNPP